MADHQEVVMTPLLAPEGMTILKVERVNRGLLDPRSVHYVAGGRYKGIVINRAANEKPEYRSPAARRKFTCYISKLKGEPMREQRQLRFWFRQGSSDMDPMADRFFKELINPHLFPRDYIGYVKRILQLLQGYPTVSKMELEMRPARPDEEDQQYVVRRMGRGRSQPPPGVAQDDYHTWHGPHSRGASRGEMQLGSPVGVAYTPDRDRGRSLDRMGSYGPTQEDNWPYAQRRGNVISQWSSSRPERRLATRSPSPGRSLYRPPFRHSQDSILAAVNSPPGLSRPLDGRHRYSIDSLDSADFRAPTDPYRIYTSSPRTDRKGIWRETYHVTSRSPSPAKVILRKLPPSPVVTRVRSSPVHSRRPNDYYSSVPVVTLHTRTLSAPAPAPAPPPPRSRSGLSRRGVQVLAVARRYRVLKLLEDAYPNSVTADELLRYYSLHASPRGHRLVDVAQLTSILQYLSNHGLVREVEPGQWMRMETVRSSGHRTWTHITQIVTELPLLPRIEMPTVGIVTLLFTEKLAVDAMMENKKTYVWRRPGDRGEGQVITLGTIGHVRVVSTKLPKPGEGESSMMVARNATTRVIGSFTTLTRVLLVGVAGGIAHFTDDRRHIRRGDIVVCKPKQARAPMYIYCTGTERSRGGDYRFASRNWVTKDETLENLINSFQIRSRKDPNICPWERYIREGMMELSGGDIDFRRPPSTTDRLVRIGPQGEVQEVPHPMIRVKSARDMRPGQPQVHFDVIGGGEALLGDYNKRRTFAMLTGAKAIDPGYQPVLEAIEEAQKDSVAIIRGIADYSDGRSDTYWQPYASLAAAAFLKAMLLELPSDG